MSFSKYVLFFALFFFLSTEHKAQCENVAFGKPVTVSSFKSGLSGNMALDGDCETLWNSGGVAPGQWIEIDLQNTYTINNINLSSCLPISTPPAVSHKIYHSQDMLSWVLMDSIVGNYVDYELVTLCYDANPIPNIRGIRIESESSPSEICWRDIGVYSLSPKGVSISSGGVSKICVGDSIKLTANSTISSPLYLWNTGETTQSIQVKDSGVYSVSVQDTTCIKGKEICAMCSNLSDSITITVVPPPVASITGNEGLCLGDSIVLTVPLGASYVWNTGDTTASIKISPTVNTQYSITATNLVCSSMDSIYVQLYPTPNITPIIYPVTCKGYSDGAVKISVSGGIAPYTYLWSNAISTTDSAFGLSAGVYTVTVINGGCISGVELVTNGDFESGNTGFSTDYPEANNGYILTKGTDHTSGTGYYMEVNGANSTINVWCQTVTVTPSTLYEFSFWTYVSTLNPPVFELKINGTKLTTFDGVSATGGWTKFSATWESASNTNASICLIDQNTILYGNDFFLDDISFKACAPDCKSIATFTLIQPDTLTTDFTFNTVCEGLPTQFNDKSSITSGSIAALNWDFGDSTSGFGASISHNFAKSGSFDVQLTAVSDKNCKDSVVKQITVFPSPVVGFNVSDSCVTILTEFTNTTIGTIDKYHWDFGTSSSSDTSSLMNPSFQYLLPGFYDIKLTAITDKGCVDSIIKTNERFPVPQPDFSPDTVCLDDSVFFSDLSTISSGIITKWVWNFDDSVSGLSNTSISQNPSHLFQIGEYGVSLTAISDKGCENNIIKQVYVNPLPSPNFFYTDSCGNDNPVQLSDLSSIESGTIEKWLWDFGDPLSGSSATSILQNPSHAFQFGNYTVSLTVFSDKGCQSIVMKSVGIYPLPKSGFFYTDSCIRKQPILLTDSSTISNGQIVKWFWHFENPVSGIPDTSTLKNPTHLFEFGKFDVSLIVSSDKGCVDTTTKLVGIYPTPESNFFYTDSCENYPILLSNSSTVENGKIVTWNWEVDTNYISDKKDLVYDFAKEGAYSVSLTVTTDYGCSNTKEEQILVFPAPKLNFYATKTEGCHLFCTNLKDNSYVSSGKITKRYWDLGNGIQTTNPDPVFCYENEGIYTLSLMVTTDHYCVDTLTKADYISVWSLPEANFEKRPEEFTTLYPNITYTDLSIGSILNREWTFYNSNGLQLGNSSDVETTYTYPSEAGHYYAQLIVSSDKGCRDTLVDSIYIKSDFSLYIPNSFSPNGDGINDYFFPTGLGFSSEDFVFNVFDRWGHIVFKSTDVNAKWDGTSEKYGRKKVLPQDTYIWEIQVRGLTEKEHIRRGYVTIAY